MITILMATYNGEKYITEQIDSLLAQTVQDFKLLICDDRSTDNTYSIIKRYSEKFPGKVIITQNSKNSGGAKHNFINMMIRHKDDYVMLCDQDDIWLPDKIEKTLEKMRAMETQNIAPIPLLIFSDLKVVDENLETISESHWKAGVVDISKTVLNHLIVQNILAGCTVMYNQELANMIQITPKYMVMHDWWLVLLASAFGKIDTINRPTILYRQHKNNDIGAKNLRSFKNVSREASNYKKMATAINQTYRQADSLIQMYKDSLSKSQVELLSAYTSIPELSRLRRLRTLVKYRTFKNGFARKIAQVIIVLKERRV